MKTLLNITLKQICAFAAGAMMMSSAYANPELSGVAIGNATVTQTATTTQINQASQQAVIDWKSFNIGANESTHFEQPAGGVALNRIDAAQGASQIYGQLSATGRIILVNGAGFYFGPNAMVNVGGLIASTSGISVANFLAGKYVFDQPSNLNGSIVNDGTIRAAAYGLVAFMGASVTNNGLIQAELGNVVLGSGSKFTLDFNGDQLVNFAIDDSVAQGVANPGVKNTGTLLADGGKILVSARAAQGVIDDVINMSGVAQARSVDERSGEIILSGGEQGTVDVSGIADVSGAAGGTIKVLGNSIHLASTANLNASGDLGGGTILIGGNYQGKGPEQNALTTTVDAGAVLNANALQSGNGGQVVVWSDNNTQFHGSVYAQGGAQSGNGGSVETSGHYLDVAGAKVNTLAANGLTGNWLLDPTDVTISTSATSNNTYSSGTYTPTTNTSNILASELLGNLATSNVSVLTASAGSANGDIAVNTALNWAAATTLSLTAARNIYLNADITATNGGLTLSAVNGTQTLTAGSIGSGTLGTTPTSVVANINVKNFTLSQGQWFQSTAGTLPTLSVSNDFSIASGSAYNGAYNAQFTRLNTSSGNGITDVYGLQGIATGPLSTAYVLNNNIDASGTLNWNAGAGFIPIAMGSTVNVNPANPFTGSFDGQNHVINGLYINRPTILYVGLFGYVHSGAANAIQNVGLTNATITGNSFVGGIAGAVAGTGSNVIVNNVYTSGLITSAGTNTLAGGITGFLVPLNNASFGGIIQNSYNAATVTSTGGSATLGGITGSTALGTIRNSYNIGTITAPLGGANVGGLVGDICSGCQSILTLTNNYNSGLVSAASGNVGALTGDTNDLSPSLNYFDNQTSGVSIAYGTIAGSTSPGLTTAQMMQSSNFSGWSIATASSSTPNSSTWFMVNGSTRPILISEEFSGNTPLTINSAHQLQLMSANITGNYSLGSNIDFSSVNTSDVWGSKFSGVTSGTGFATVAINNDTFTGILNGQNYTINSLYMNVPGQLKVGLFGNGGGTIENLGLTNVNITGSDQVGAIAGLFSTGLMQNVYATGVVAGATNDQYGVGGLVGLLAGGTIQQSFSTANVSAGSRVGGLVGQSFGGAISNSYSTGSVTVTTNNNSFAASGGFIGVGSWNSPTTITNSYSSGVVNAGTGNSLVGGFMGTAQSNLTASNNYWDTQTSGQATSYSGTGLTTTQMMNPANFNTWDFATTPIWGIVSGNTRPFLNWKYQGISGTLTGGTVSGVAINIASNGAAVSLAQSNLTTNGSGFYYGVFDKILYSINNPFLVYASGGLNTASTVALFSNTAANSATVNLTSNTVNVQSANGAFSNALLQTAMGNLSSTNTLYSVSGPAPSANLTLNSGVSLNVLSGTSYTINGGITASGAGTLAFGGPVTINNSGATISSAGNQTYSGAVTLASAGSLTSSAGGISLANITGAGFGLTINNNAASTISGIFSGTGSSLTKAGTGTLTLSGVNTYSGITTINAGILSINADSGLGTAPGAFTANAITFGGGKLYTPIGLVLNANRGITYAIGALQLTPSLTGTVSKTYDATTAATLAAGNYSSTGLTGGDVAAFSSSSSTYDTKNVGTGKTVTASGVTASVTNSSTSQVYGYQLASSTASGAVGTITAANLTVTADAQTKTYGTNDPSLTYTTTGLFAGDSLTGNLNRTISSATENVGTYAILQNTLAASSNYTLSYVSNNLTITPATLTVIANAASKISGMSDPVFTYNASGFINKLVDGITISDSANNVLSGALARQSSSEAAGTYPITQGSLTCNSNYNINYTSANLTITSASSSVPSGAQTAITTAATLTNGSGLTYGNTA
ncbi:MAG: MBG domain-containing protein, partial [Gammaproteobacteria bacterium]|nr:MBG domain-containing protein [Gammaproteobacteria bacterium]